MAVALLPSFDRITLLPHPEVSEMCGLIKMLIYRKGVTDVLHVTKDEVKKTRQRLTAEDWTIYHTELI